jgi:CubicO group peptidase (beta-lactamase class C family)
LTLNCFYFSAISSEQDADNGAQRPALRKSKDLNEVLHKADEMPFLKSLIVIQDGNVVIEKYMNGGHADLQNDIKSASKSILSALLGIAIHDGYVKDIDQKVMQFFPEYQTSDHDSRLLDLTIRHLIMMRTGFAIRETGKAYEDLYNSSDWIKHILNLPFHKDAGKEFNYLSFNTHLLSAIITKTTGKNTFEYADEVLFSPLGIKNVKWQQDPNGYAIGGWGISLKAQDMAKFGMLYVNDGIYKGKRLLPAEWIRESTIERTGMIGTYYSRFWDNSYGYGYLWWVKRLDNAIDVPFAQGHAGQRIAVFKKANAVMVTQTNAEVDFRTSHRQHRAVDELLFKDVANFLLKYNRKSD